MGKNDLQQSPFRPEFNPMEIPPGGGLAGEMLIMAQNVAHMLAESVGQGVAETIEEDVPEQSLDPRLQEDFEKFFGLASTAPEEVIIFEILRIYDHFLYVKRALSRDGSVRHLREDFLDKYMQSIILTEIQRFEKLKTAVKLAQPFLQGLDLQVIVDKGSRSDLFIDVEEMKEILLSTRKK